MPEITGRLRTPRLPSAPSTPSVGEVYYDTATSTLYWWNGAGWWPCRQEAYEQTSQPGSTNVGALWIDSSTGYTTASGIPLVTSLPASPYDGQEVYLRYAGAGIPLPTTPATWHLRYSASLGKWEFLGGAPLVMQQTGQENLTANGAWTYGPGLYVYWDCPFAGDFDYECRANMYGAAANISLQVGLGVGVPNQTPTVPNYGLAQVAAAGGAASVDIAGTLYGVVAGWRMIQHGSISGGGTGAWRDRRLAVWPRRIS